MNSMPFVYLILIFILAAIVIWKAGVTLVKTTDSLDTRFKIGDAFGGLIFLGIATSLPELAIVISAALAGHYSVIIGNLVGGIAIQTLLIALFDYFTKGKRPLSYHAGSKILSFEGLWVILIALAIFGGTKVSQSHSIFHLNPFSIIIVALWLFGLYFINRNRKNPKYNITPEDADPGRKHHERRAKENHPFYANKSTVFVFVIFLLAALVTFIAGVLVERTGVQIAQNLGISSGLFAATALAFVTALPEISTGLESIFIGDNQLAISDIFGGNAFMPALFVLADLIAHKPVLSFGTNLDRFLVVVGIAMTLVYCISFISKLRVKVFRIGYDSIVEIVLFIIGMFALQYLM